MESKDIVYIIQGNSNLCNAHFWIYESLNSRNKPTKNVRGYKAGCWLEGGYGYSLSTTERRRSDAANISLSMMKKRSSVYTSKNKYGYSLNS